MVASLFPRSLYWRIGGLVIALALLAVAPAAAHAQTAPGQGPGIVAVGFGRAAAPASAATLQFLLSPGDFGYFGPSIETVLPVADEGDAAASPAIGPGLPEAMPPGPPSLTAEQLDPVVEALVTAGASQEAITANAPVLTNAFYGPGGPETGEIKVVVADPEAAMLAELVDAATAAAGEAGLTVLHIGARYDAADCAALLQQAREAAVADARERAEGLATAVGATLGELTQASETPFFGPTGGGSCGAEGMPDEFFGPYGPGTDPAFDPSASGEAEAYVQVTLTYAFEAGMAATPAP